MMRAVLALMFVLTLTARGYAQFDTATVLGSVKDGTGAVLPGVTVTLANVDTGVTRSYADMASPAGRREIATYAKGIGANQRLILPASKDGTVLPPTTIIADAHAAGLLVHVRTLRSEPLFLSPSYNGDPRAEFRQFAELGVDGIFTDFPDVGVEALRK